MPHEDGKKEQAWKLEDQFITNINYPDKVLDIIKENNRDEAEICMFKKHGKMNQRWSISYV